MGFSVIPFKAEHGNLIKEQRVTAELRSSFGPTHLEALESLSSPAYTVKKGDKFLGCVGLARYSEYRGEVWAMLDCDLKKDFIFVHRVAQRLISMKPILRMEAVVDCEFVQGHRWIKLLGFSLEAPLMKAYHPNGRDCALYARVER